MLIDTHAHLHFLEYKSDLDEVFSSCRENRITSIINIGTTDEDSKRALEFCINNKPNAINLYASVGIHPHEASSGEDSLLNIKDLVISGEYESKLVAIGECGLDYYRQNSTKREQFRALEFQIELAIDQDLPVVFHVRDAWDDFFAIINNYKNLRGVIHSFTGGLEQVEKAEEQNLYFGINGIITFTKEAWQLEAVKQIPADRLLLETDSPYLAPPPFRGKRNDPSKILQIAEFISGLRSESFENLAETTTNNAKTLFAID